MALRQNRLGLAKSPTAGVIRDASDIASAQDLEWNARNAKEQYDSCHAAGLNRGRCGRPLFPN
jgi:hypothetical protein